MEAGVPEEPTAALTGVGDSRSRTQSPWHRSGTGLHRSLLSTAEAGQGGAVRCLLGLTVLLLRAQPPQGCLAAWVAIALFRAGSPLSIKWRAMLVPCWPVSSV